MNQDCARVIPVIETTIARRGDGTSESSPIRIITQYWSFDGELLWEIDPCRAPTSFESAV
jgi:hypothetical protein